MNKAESSFRFKDLPHGTTILPFAQIVKNKKGTYDVVTDVKTSNDTGDTTSTTIKSGIKSRKTALDVARKYNKEKKLDR